MRELIRGFISQKKEKDFLIMQNISLRLYDEMEIAFKNTDFTGRLRHRSQCKYRNILYAKTHSGISGQISGIKVQVKINTTAVVEKNCWMES